MIEQTAPSGLARYSQNICWGPFRTSVSITRWIGWSYVSSKICQISQALVVRCFVWAHRNAILELSNSKWAMHQWTSDTSSLCAAVDAGTSVFDFNRSEMKWHSAIPSRLTVLHLSEPQEVHDVLWKQNDTMKRRRSTSSRQRKCVKINVMYHSPADIAMMTLIDRILWNQPTLSRTGFMTNVLTTRSSLHIGRWFSHTKLQRSHAVWSIWGVNAFLWKSWHRLSSESCTWLCTSRLRRKARESVYRQIFFMKRWGCLLLMCL